MESETLPEKQEDMEMSAGSVALSIDREDVEGKLTENIVDVEALAVGARPPAVVRETILPDLTLFNYEVQQGYRIFRELLSDQYKSVTYPFIDPVDVKGLNLWDYHARIETPMSLSQIENKFKSYVYQSITEIVSDMRLILENCYRYNGSAHWISKLAHKLEKIIDQKLALLNRSLREKVTLRATMAFRSKKIVENNPEPELSGRPRRSARTSYGANGMKSEERSSLMTHLLMEEEENQREIKRLKEKEKKEANEALMQELNEWETEIFTSNVLTELRSMWEIPSIGSFLWLFQAALNLPELNFTEFEHGFVLPHKSQQMAWIFTSLLVTPSQRKSLHKRSPMKFKVWERKLKERLDVWYLARKDEELQMVARQIGLNPTFFDVLGESNPLETKSYVDLTLHQRVLILKVLCDECLDYQPQLRDVLGNTDTTPYSETYLGYDAENSTYLYFPVFDATDIRVYKQSELPSLSEWYRKWTSHSRSYQTPKRTNQSKSRRSSTSKSTSKKSKGLSTTIEPGFELVCDDVESLRELCEKFSEPPATPSRKKSGGRPTRRRSEKELHKMLSELVEELGKSDARYTRARVKGMVNLMNDWKVVEEMSDSGDEFNAQDGEIEEPAGVSLQSPLDNELPAIPDNTSAEQIPGEGTTPLLTMVTRSRNRKRRFLDYDDITSASSSPLSEISKNFESESGVLDDNQDPRIDIRFEKRPTLNDDVMKSNEICDAVVRDVINDVISNVLASEVTDVVMNCVDNGGIKGTILARGGNEGSSEDKMDVNSDVVENVDHQGVAVDKVQQATNHGNSSNEGNQDTAMDIDGFADWRNHSTFTDRISNGYVGLTNGSTEGLVELNQSIGSCTRNIDSELDPNLHKHNEVNDCPIICEPKAKMSSQHQSPAGIQGISQGITVIEGTNVHRNGQCGKVMDECNSVFSLDNDSGRSVPTDKEPTGVIPIENLPRKTILAGKIPMGTPATIIEPKNSGN